MVSINTELFNSRIDFWRHYYHNKKSRNSQEYFRRLDIFLNKFYDDIYIEFTKQLYFIGVLNSDRQILRLRKSIEQSDWTFNKDLNCEECVMCGEPLVGYITTLHCCKHKIHKDCLYRCMTEVKKNDYSCPFCRCDLCKEVKETKLMTELNTLSMETTPPRFITKDSFKRGMMDIISGNAKTDDINDIIQNWDTEVKEMDKNKNNISLFKCYLEILYSRLNDNTKEDDVEEDDEFDVF